MCSDGPDYYEGDPETGEQGITLKCIWISVEKFCEQLSNLEVLGQTPSEVNKKVQMQVVPPVIMVPDYPGALQGSLVTPREMREAKRKLLWSAVAEGKVVDGEFRVGSRVPLSAILTGWVCSLGYGCEHRRGGCVPYTLYEWKVRRTFCRRGSLRS